MTRADLLALTLDDLTVLSNRGLVKRAQRELESEEFTYQSTESDDGTLTLQWSDGFDCILPAGSVICDRHCTCTATTLCRHLIRSVLAYQRQTGELPKDPQPSAPTVQDIAPVPAQQPWNPGEIPDTEIAQHFKATQLKQLQRQFETQQVIELMGGLKPIARLHSSGHTLRFLVPGDLRYTYCDCAAPAPCPHVPLAIWAFRRLSPTQKSGLISTESPTDAPVELLDEIETALRELVKTGLKGVSDACLGRLRRLEQVCRQEILIWPAEILTELLQECDRYRQRDARFSPTRVVELIGELYIRMDAIRNATGAVPQLFIRGTQSDRIAELGAARLIGLGCSVQTFPQNVRLTSYFQDTDSGAVMAFTRNFTDVPPTPPEPTQDFWKMAQAKVLKQTSMEQLGAGQLLIKSGKRSTDFQFLPGRSQVIVNPQTFQWENLRAPLLVENFADFQERLKLLPPSSLSPRRCTETLQVLAVDHVQGVEFCPVEQAVIAQIYDLEGNLAKLYFPYTQRAHVGVEALLNNLNQMTLKFIAGNIYPTLNQMVIHPISLVFQGPDYRILLQPWIHSNTVVSNSYNNATTIPSIQDQPQINPIENYFQLYLETLAEIIILGLESNKFTVLNLFQKLYDNGLEIGFSVLLNPLKQMIFQLNSEDYDPVQGSIFLESMELELIRLLRFAQDYVY